jgi:glycine cleavage system transcriptional repressor
MTDSKEQQLVISAIGQDRPGLVSKLTTAVMDSGGNILDSRMTVLGGEFAVLILVSAPWNALAKLEGSLPALEQQLGLTLISKRTQAPQTQLNALPYHVEVVSIDHPGIVNQIASFFSNQGINIQELNTVRYLAAHTGAPLFSMSMTVNIPMEISLGGLRERFFTLCDEQNIDAIIEPIKM